MYPMVLMLSVFIYIIYFNENSYDWSNILILLAHFFSAIGGSYWIYSRALIYWSVMLDLDVFYLGQYRVHIFQLSEASGVVIHASSEV